MKIFTQSEPLTDAVLDRLGDFLKGCKCGEAMNLEQLDGFFAALIAGPETVMPSEYYREVFGGEMSDACEFGSLDEANEILGLMMRNPMNVSVKVFRGDFPTVSYQNCWLDSVRWDLTEARKGSSYAKHCILLIAFAVEIGSEKIPLPAPRIPSCVLKDLQFLLPTCFTVCLLMKNSSGS